MKTLIRITTVPSSLRTLLKGQLRFMNQYYRVIGVSSKGDALNEVYQNEGVEVKIVEMTRNITPIKDIKAVVQLYKLFKKERPFIVHTHTPKAGTVGMIAAKFAGIPNRVHTVAGLPLLEIKGLKRFILNYVEKLTYACATHVLPNSKGLETIILNNKFTNKNKLSVLANGSSNGIDTKHYDVSLVETQTRESLKNQLGITNHDFVFIFIGRMVSDKGINELVEAFNKLSLNNRNCKLLLVGPHENNLDPLLPSTERLMKSNVQILVLGVQKDIRPYVAISHALVLPSYREGFPNVVLQASCMGLPCIVSNINGCNEIIENQVNGIIIPVKNEEAIFKAMEYLIINPNKCSEMASQSRKRTVELFEQQFVWNCILEFYKNLE